MLSILCISVSLILKIEAYITISSVMRQKSEMCLLLRCCILNATKYTLE